MKQKIFLIFTGTFLVLLLMPGCANQYGVGTYNYHEKDTARKRETVGAHGTSNRISMRDERKRIKYYNNPEYKRKLLEKRQKKNGKSTIDSPKSRG